jgi:hypothetical protein
MPLLARTIPRGQLGLHVIHESPCSEVPGHDLSLGELLQYGFPRASQAPLVRQWKHRNARHFWRGLRRVVAAKLLHIPMLQSRVSLLVRRADGRVEDLLLASVGQIVTNAGVNFIADKFNGETPADIALFIYHGIGTGTVDPVVGDTALGTELTTQYLTNSTRPTGTQSNPSANIYRSTATVTVDSGPISATEWGLFTQAAVPGGTMLDRIEYAVVTLAANDSIVPTFDFTLPSGG